MARRGFLAELNHQMQVNAREQERRVREAERARSASYRMAEQARRAEERATAQYARASSADQKRLAKEAREAHVAAMEAEVERRNVELSQLYDEIDSLLAATLDVDDYVDLATLRSVAEHPPFDRADLETPVPLPRAIPDPPEPIFAPPTPPQGLKGLLGGKKHEKAVAEAAAAHEVAVAQWKSALVEVESARKAKVRYHADQEAKRVAALEVERARYAEECAASEAAVVERNKALDTLIADLGYGAVHAVHEYVSIVLSNSVYPAHFPVEHDFEFDPTSAELRLKVLVPSPDKLPTTAAHKYTKSADEITTTALSQKACKDRYANAVLQVALRSMHEVSY
jgi:restriction system protein